MNEQEQIKNYITSPPEQRFRLAGTGLSNFLEPRDLGAQSALFE